MASRTYRNTTQTLKPGLSQSVKDLNLTSECETFLQLWTKQHSTHDLRYGQILIYILPHVLK